MRRYFEDYTYDDSATYLSIYRDSDNALYVVNGTTDERYYELPPELTVILKSLISDYQDRRTTEIREIKFASIITNKTGVLFPISYHSYPPDVTLCYSVTPKKKCEIPFDGIVDRIYWIDDNWHFVARWPRLP